MRTGDVLAIAAGYVSDINIEHMKSVKFIIVASVLVGDGCTKL